MLITERRAADILIAGYQTTLSAKLNCASEDAPLVVFAHGFAGNKDEKGLFVEADRYFVSHGLSILRFDFRGCGDNNGSFSKVRFSDLEIDLHSVLKFVKRDLDFTPRGIGLVGFSLGATIAILANSKIVDAYAFWSPAIFTDVDMYPRYDTHEVRREIEQKGFFLKSGIEVGPDFLHDLKQNAVREKTKVISKPVLMVHGEDDSRISVANTRAACPLFGRRSRLCIIPGADHSFRNDPMHREYVFSASVKFFRERLSAPPKCTLQTPLLFDQMNRRIDRESAVPFAK